MAGNTPQYYGTIPTIAQAYQNDPRSKLAQSALALGTSTAPVAQGGWAVTDGLARAAQAVLGAVMTKKQDQKYGQREQAYVAGMQDAARMAGTPQPGNPAALNPATVNPAMEAAAGALSGTQPTPGTMQPASMAVPQTPMRTVDPNTALGAPQGAAMTPPGPPLPVGGGMAPTGLPSPSGGGYAGPMATGAGGIPPIGGPADPIGGGTGHNRGAVQFVNPLGTYRATPTSGFGQRGAEFHNGQDWAAPQGTPIGAAAPGTVIAAGTDRRNGNFVRIRHADGTITGYAHLNETPLAQRGQTVEGGAQIGSVGHTGNVRGRTGNHLHFTVTDARGRKVDPNSVQYGASPVVTGGTEGASGLVDAGVPAAQMEAVPEGPTAPAQAPAAPARPAEVSTNRIPMAQALMASGNPDLMAIAQTYLDKGLDEQNAARTLASQQEFQQGQTGYDSSLTDFRAARSDARGVLAADRRGAQDRNFQRGERQADQTFRHDERLGAQAYGTSERIGSQQFQTGERTATQAFQAQQQQSQNGWQASQNDAERQNRLDVAGIRRGPQGARDQARNAYFSTPTGLRMQQAAGVELNSNNAAIDKYSRFMDLNGRQGTGGAALNTPGIAAAYRWTNSDLTEMNALANDTTLAAIGGSLGTAISDGDRRFISDSNISTTAPRQANINIARARIGALRRKNDYIVEFANAQADGTAQTFAQDWQRFAQATPLVQYDRNGNATATTDRPVTFSQWRASRPRYDAQGRRVQQ